MKNNKGFISISVVYSFFLVFIAIVMSIIVVYSNRRVLINEVKNNIRDSIENINNGVLLKDAILANNEIVTIPPDFSKVTSGLYKAEDDYGVSYYFRGADVNNYVSLKKVYDEGFSGVCLFGRCEFDNKEGKYKAYCSTKEECIADVESGVPWTADDCVEVSLEGAYVNEYWKIIRINGDGTIRLIYSGIRDRISGGTYKHQIGESSFNPTTVDKSIWGKYTYEENGTQKDSTMKTFLENWYENNLETNYSDIIADSIFCNDRELGYRSGGNQYFAVYSRIRDAASPQLTCTNKSDRYTVLDESIGNGLLKHPIGLITADEAFMAGVGFNGSNYQNNSYLIGMGTVTMSQYIISSNWPGMIQLGGSYFDFVQDKGNKKVIPVINLKADVVLKSGDGTIDSPYEIVMEEAS